MNSYDPSVLENQPRFDDERTGTTYKVASLMKAMGGNGEFCALPPDQITTFFVDWLSDERPRPGLGPELHQWLQVPLGLLYGSAIRRRQVGGCERIDQASPSCRRLRKGARRVGSYCQSINPLLVGKGTPPNRCERHNPTEWDRPAQFGSTDRQEQFLSTLCGPSSPLITV